MAALEDETVRGQVPANEEVAAPGAPVSQVGQVTALVEREYESGAEKVVVAVWRRL